jgi:hypothetical protein
VKLSQILGELKYKLQGGQKIKKGVDIKWDPRLPQGRKKRYLNFGQLIV